MNAKPSLPLDGQTIACPWLYEIEQRARQGAYSVRIFAQADSAARWRCARNWRRVAGPGTATLLPPGERPAALRWPAGTVIADVTGELGDVVCELAEALIRDGCTLGFLTDTASNLTHRVLPAKDGVPCQL
jgi:hypothetical protein